MKKSLFYFIKKSLLVAGALLPCVAMAVEFPSNTNAARAGSTNGIQFLSQYGQIQNVQSYSSNPFYNQDSPYNQRPPVPVYVQGTEINAGECRATVASVLAMQCGMKNNCAGMRVQDIRPYVLQSLSVLPGHNYVSACGGFIDAVFEDYMAQSQNLKSGKVAFPTATNAPNAPKKEFKVDNPYEIRLMPYQQEIYGRIDELAALQAQNAEDPRLVVTDMPKTFEELDFTERNAILAAGYAQWQCDPKTGKNCTYKPIDVETNEERYIRETAEMQQKQTAMEAKQTFETAKQKLDKDRDPCAWCKANQIKCFSEYTDSITKINTDLQAAACANNATSVLLWEIRPSEKCGYNTPTHTMTKPLSPEICRVSQRNTETEYAPIPCKDNANKCPDGTCPETHPGSVCPQEIHTPPEGEIYEDLGEV